MPDVCGMIEKMLHNRTRRGTAGTWRSLLVLLCVGLVLVCGTAGVAHAHADGALGHADCGLCATAHAVADKAVHPLADPALIVVELRVARPKHVFVAQPTRVALFSRPPPVSASSL